MNRYIIPPKIGLHWILSISVFCAILFSLGCSKKNQDSSLNFHEVFAEAPWMEKFIDDYFLGKITLYTLFGTKPMTELPVCFASKEEWAANVEKVIRAEYPKDAQEAAIAEFTTFLNQYDLPENSEKWTKWGANNLNHSYLFSKRPTFSESIFSLYILNVQEAAWVLQRYYDSISRELSIEFDPLKVVMKFEDLDSPFWTRVFESHYVRGLLHGFGERNAFFFDRSVKNRGHVVEYVNGEALFKSHLSEVKEKKKLPIPGYRSYWQNQQDDPAYQRFAVEEKEISKLLGEGNPYELILKRLGYKRPETP